MRPPGSTGPFIRKYIFPGAYVPSLSEVFAATERAGLWVADMEVLRLHYHYTLRHWRRRFAANRARAAELYDERFCRMWEYYLAAVDVGFSNGSNMVFQLLLSAKIDAVPILRDYMVDDLRAASLNRDGASLRSRFCLLHCQCCCWAGANMFWHRCYGTRSCTGPGVNASGNITTDDRPDAHGFYRIIGITGTANGEMITGFRQQAQLFPGIRDSPSTT